jgi:hypothetical protein
MNRIAQLLIAVSFLFATGCAKTDWIERTLVTVDVTRTWYATLGGEGAFVRDFLFDLEQTGSTVKVQHVQYLTCHDDHSPRAS